MSVPRKRRLTREESKARTKAELLRAANRLFLKNGFVATSLAEIAEEAGLTKGAVYSNFASKEDLFLAVLEDEGVRRTESDQAAGPYAIREIEGASAAERAEAFGRHVASVKPSRRYIALFLEMNAFALRDDRARKWVDGYNSDFFADFGSHLVELLDADEADAELLGFVAQSLYVGVQMHAAYSDEPLDADAHARIFGALAAVAKSGKAARGRR